MQATRRIRRIRGLQSARGPGGRKEGERQMFREGGELVACLLAGVAMLNNRVAGTFSRNEDVYQDPATGNWFTNRPREAAPLHPEQPRLDPSFTLLLLSPWQRRISLNFRAAASMEDALKCRCETTNRPTPLPPPPSMMKLSSLGFVNASVIRILMPPMEEWQEWSTCKQSWVLLDDLNWN